MEVFRSGGPGLWLLMAGPFPAALGLFFVRSWGYYFYIVFSALAVIYNSYLAIWFPVLWNGGSALQTIYLLISMAYFFRSEISAPFIYPGVRGWRKAYRLPIRLDVKLAGHHVKSVDLSSSGMSVSYPDSSFAPGSSVALSFKLRNQLYELKGGIVETRGDIVAIAFRGVDRESQESIDRWLEGR